MTERICRRASRRGRRGVALLVVMLLIAVTLAVSYVSMRSQTMTLQGQSNAMLRVSARDVALTGMSIALRTMQTSSWAGVSTMLSRSLGSGRRFEATYTTGDASMSSSDSAYSEYPYRVTVDVTAYIADPSRPSHEISHRLRAVVRLVRRALATEPTGWIDITANTLCQWSQGNFQLTVPCRIEGPVRIRAPLDLCDDFLNWAYDHRSLYLSGLKSMKDVGQPDWRPFNVPVKLTSADQSANTRSLLTQDLGIAIQDYPETTSIVWPAASLPTGYRLYPGGALYTVPTVASELRNTTLGPDPKTNPLGVFTRNGSVRIYENVTVRGTLFLSGAGGDLEVYGANAKLYAVDLPPVQDNAGALGSPIRLPTVFAQDDVNFHDGSRMQATGLVIALDQFLVDEADHDNMTLAIQGKLTAHNVQLRRRSEWNQSSTWWNIAFAFYQSQHNHLGGYPYFPSYLQQYWGLNAQPLVTIVPDASTILYHWQNPNDPVYVPHSSDVSPLDPTHPGLRWELVTWIDNPQS